MPPLPVLSGREVVRVLVFGLASYPAAGQLYHFNQVGRASDVVCARS